MTTALLPSAGDESAGKRRAEAGMALAVLLVVSLLVVPLPGVLLDLALALSIALSLVVLLVALYTHDPLEFSSFPALLLVMTLFRLALNISSTRLILSKGEAGKVIQAFGQFVIGGNYIVGLVIFLILIGINFVVITKGAGRVAGSGCTLHAGCDAGQAGWRSMRILALASSTKRKHAVAAPRSRDSRISMARWTARPSL